MPFTPDEFKRRRTAIFDAIGSEAVAVIQGARELDSFAPFRQTNQFYYLCGVEEPHAYLLLDGRNRSTSLFLPEIDEHKIRSEGPGGLSDEEITVASGVDQLIRGKSFSEKLVQPAVIFTPHGPAETMQMCRDTCRLSRKAIEADPWDSLPSRENLFISKLRDTFPAVVIEDLTPTIDKLRLIKSPAEVERMKRSANLTVDAIIRAMQLTRAGMYEYELGAIADEIYLSGGALCGGYRPIIASGQNIWYSHYWRNNSELVDGDWVLMDYAPDLDYYTSDIGRYWPINGKYSPVQRELYSFILKYHQTLLDLIQPGLMGDAILDKAAEIMNEVIHNTHFSKPCYREGALKSLEYRGHLSHTVGMAVHDSGVYMDKPLEPGTVFAVDPQMWIPEEELYVRVEDTIVVTADGLENLTGHAPREMDNVEQAMAAGPQLQG